MRNALVRSLLQQPLIIHVLRVVLCIAVYSIELATFWPYLSRCRSRLSPEAGSAPIQLRILTDPQIITGDPHPSYPGFLARVFFPLARTFTDRYLSRAWRALRSPGRGVRDWTATIWMGDLTDTGRDHTLQEGLPELYDRFARLFPAKATSRTLYLPGNHDINIQAPSTWHDPPFNAYWLLQGREYTRVKFLHLFGTTVQDLSWDAAPVLPPTSLSHTIIKPELDGMSRYTTKKDHFERKTFNARVPIKVAHADGSPPSTVAEVILLDAIDIVSLQRMGRHPHTEPPDGKPGTEADWRIGGSWWFLTELSKSKDPSIPRILFTHIPLYRDPKEDVETSCRLPAKATFPSGVMPAAETLTRQSARPIQMGTDAKGTYENLISAEWSNFILDNVEPSVIFSGDDHDYCHHLHAGGSTVSIPELTVNAFSLTSGVRTPGYARLSIWQDGLGSTQPLQTRIEYTACALPPQIKFWAQMYPLVVVLTAVILFARRALLNKNSTHASRGSKNTASSLLPRWASSAEDTPESHPLHVIGGEDDEDEDEEPRRSPTSGSQPRSRRNSHASSHRTRSRSRSPSRMGAKASPASLRISLPSVGETRDHDHGRPQQPTSTLRLFLLDSLTVAWVPFVYWLALWIFGF